MHLTRSVMLVVVLTGTVISTAGRGAEAQDAKTVILNTQSLWRYRLIWETEEVRLKSGEMGHYYLKLDRKTRTRSPEKVKAYRLPPVTSPDWIKPDFDDGAWGRFRGPFGGYSLGMKNLCLRGRFEVTDPSRAGGLTLSLSLYGGAVVYLNGEELARAFMPEGKIDLRTSALDYPLEAYIDTDGFILTESSGMRRKYPQRYGQRVRDLVGLKIPVAKLKKGTNVLAVSIHRPPAHVVMYTHRIRAYNMTAYDSRSRATWGRVALRSLSLTASPGAAVVPNVGRPRGFQVWNQATACKPYAGDYGDANEPLRPIRIVGVRNGAFSGQIVAGSTEPIKGLTVRVTDLGGPGTIPAAAIQIRYALPDGQDRRFQSKLSVGTPFDSLEEVAPAVVPVREGDGGAVQPIWFTVNVPSDAAPGGYEGMATVRADGVDPVRVPLRLRVIDWRMPAPRDFLGRMDVVQSPESVAMRYGVPLWSDEHWRLLDKTFALLGQLGNETLYVTCIRRTHWGNEHGMIRWIRHRDGRLKPDLSIAERYLDTAVKHMGRIPAVVLHCWEPPNSVGHAGFGPGRTHDREILISVLDPDTGELSKERGPAWGTPESRAFWRPMVEGWQRVLEKRGMGGSMMFGLVGDHRPTKQAMDDICAAVPKATWTVHSHHYADVWQGYPIGFCAAVWGIKARVVDPDEGRGYGWQKGFWLASYPRGVHDGSTLSDYRTYIERYIGAVRYPHMAVWPISKGVSGIGRIGADFWRVIKRGDTWRYALAGRYPETAWGQLNITYATAAILGPGRDGPVATLRSEAYRQNLQEIEARAFIERALLDEALKARLGDDLVRRCRVVLDERIRACIRTAGPNGWAWYIGSGYQQRTERLFALAAEVAAKLNGR